MKANNTQRRRKVLFYDPTRDPCAQAPMFCLQTVAYNNTPDWMMTYGYTEDQAITATTVAVDFGITQVSAQPPCDAAQQ
jgi:hypothetical protein